MAQRSSQPQPDPAAGQRGGLVYQTRCALRQNIQRGCAFASALMLGRTMNMDDAISEEELAALEVTLPTALELCRLGLASMIDIRQTFEIEMKGAIPDSVHIPLFEVKRMLGHTLTEDEQDILDAGKPKDMDAMSFFSMINQLHHARDHLLLCVCNSGRRSLAAASLLRSLGYPKALSVAGGFQAWKKLNDVALKTAPPSTAS